MTLDDFTVEIAGDWPCHISLPLAIAVQFNHAFDATLSLSTLYTAPKQGKTGFVTKCRSKGSPRQETRTLIGQSGLPTYITLFRWAEDTVGSQPISGR